MRHCEPFATDGLLFEGDCSRCGSVAGIAADIVVTIAMNPGAIGRLPARAVAGDRRLSHANYGGRRASCVFGFKCAAWLLSLATKMQEIPGTAIMKLFWLRTIRSVDSAGAICDQFLNLSHCP